MLIWFGALLDRPSGSLWGHCSLQTASEVTMVSVTSISYVIKVYCCCISVIHQIFPGGKMTLTSSTSSPSDWNWGPIDFAVAIAPLVITWIVCFSGPVPWRHHCTFSRRSNGEDYRWRNCCASMTFDSLSTYQGQRTVCHRFRPERQFESPILYGLIWLMSKIDCVFRYSCIFVVPWFSKMCHLTVWNLSEICQLRKSVW